MKKFKVYWKWVFDGQESCISVEARDAKYAKKNALPMLKWIEDKEGAIKWRSVVVHEVECIEIETPWHRWEAMRGGKNEKI